MRRDQASALQIELQQFISQTENRLNGLRAALNRLKHAAQATEHETSLLGSRARTAAATEAVKKPQAIESGSELNWSQRSSATKANVAGNLHGQATVVERTAVDGAADATDRLEAIKRRLAEQIENA